MNQAHASLMVATPLLCLHCWHDDLLMYNAFCHPNLVHIHHVLTPEIYGTVLVVWKHQITIPTQYQGAIEVFSGSKYCS